MNELWHPKDIDYFKEYPAPVMEQIQKLHYTNINSTITFYGPMLYFLIRGLCCEHVLEIGVAEGYTAFYLANAVKDNGTRFGMKNNMYYGVDNRKIPVAEKLDELGLPNKILHMDSKDLSSETFKDVVFDVVFQDGDHSTEAVIREFELFWPQLKGGGKGYWVFHDCYGPAEEGFRAIKKRFDEKEFNGEYIRLDSVYGLAMIRKLDDYDENKRHWKD
jgi:SAM-dependent methyltransferase